jgi:hypothetical protein
VTQREIEMKITDNAALIASLLKNGKDCEIRKSKDGISVAEVTKKVVVK